MRLVTAILCGFMLLSASLAAQEPTTVTGCINNADKLDNLAVGDQPSAPCAFNETEITLQLAGHPNPLNTFAYQLIVDDELIIAQHGATSIVVRCGLRPAQDGGGPYIEIFGESALPGFLVTEPIRVAFPNSFPRPVEIFRPAGPLTAISVDGAFVFISTGAVTIYLNEDTNECALYGAYVSGDLVQE